MDLIYTNSDKIDMGVLHKFEADIDIATEKDFEITVGQDNNVLSPGCYLYVDNTEYGGIVDAMEIKTESGEIAYTGRCWRGILKSKVILPPQNEDYLILSGTISSVVKKLIADAEYSDLFIVEDCEIPVNGFKFDRYIDLYSGIKKCVNQHGKELGITYHDKYVKLSFYDTVDYSDSVEYTQDNLNFTIKKTYGTVNHLICLGQGELKERQVVHLYVDRKGNLCDTQRIFGMDEIVEVYENTGAGSIDELKSGGIIRLKELSNQDSFSVTVPDIALKIGDIIGGYETITNTYVAREIVNIIARITEHSVDIEYKVGEDAAKSEKKSGETTGGGSSGGGGGGTPYTLPVATASRLGGIKVGTGLNIETDGTLNAEAKEIEVDAFLSTTSVNPVQNKVITEKMNQVFRSVSDGKSKVASAITDKGVTTEADATFSVMAENISKIKKGLEYDVIGVKIVDFETDEINNDIPIISYG